MAATDWRTNTFDEEALLELLRSPSNEIFPTMSPSIVEAIAPPAERDRARVMCAASFASFVFACKNIPSDENVSIANAAAGALGGPDAFMEL